MKKMRFEMLAMNADEGEMIKLVKIRKINLRMTMMMMMMIVIVIGW